MSESHPAFADFMADLSAALMPLVEDDFQKLLEVLMVTHNASRRDAIAMIDAMIDKKMLRKFVRKFIPAPDALEKRIEDVFSFYSVKVRQISLVCLILVDVQ